VTHCGFCYIADSVPESVSIPAVIAADDLALSQKSSGNTKRHLIAALFSAVVPGVGQLFLGQRRKGLILLLVLGVVFIGFWPARLLRFYAGFVLLYCGWIILYLYSACNAQLARNRQTGVRASKWWLVAVIPIATVSLSLLGQAVTRASGFRSFTVPSPSMERTILKGDPIVADMWYYQSRPPVRQDVIVFKKEGTFFIKRVIAVGDDIIQGTHGNVFVNGQTISEPYVQHSSHSAPDWTMNFGPIKVANGKYFVMGDNRDVSLDSRSSQFGLVDKSLVVGKPLYVFGSDRPGQTVR
jgi:signal peptidase I